MMATITLLCVKIKDTITPFIREQEHIEQLDTLTGGNVVYAKRGVLLSYLTKRGLSIKHVEMN
jgi:hypothetical protein